MAPSPKKRVVYVDALRSCAALLVVASHVFAPVSASWSGVSLPTWWIFNLLNSLIRPSAALFVMISGNLLLGSTREESYFHFIWRRCSKLILPFFTWSMIYAYMEARMQKIPFSIEVALRQFVRGPTEYHLWFMYVILSLYLVAPWIRRFVQKAGPPWICAVLTLWAGLLTLQFCCPGDWTDGRLVTFADYAGYFILGYVLGRFPLAWASMGRTSGAALVLIFLNAVMTFVLTLGDGGTLNNTYYAFYSPLQALYGAAFFLTMKNLSYDRVLSRFPTLRENLQALSRDSYNLYLIHPFFIWLFIKGDLGFVLSDQTGKTPFIGVPLTTLAVLTACWIFIRLFKPIPWVGRLFLAGPA